ncbi:MAG TPA: hypothetical protein PKB10_10040, partial [Tepidisphaeraceae bacterium]|nr:hypothetical protein [Tepidisphaeraceae bacterium]
SQPAPTIPTLRVATISACFVRVIMVPAPDQMICSRLSDDVSVVSILRQFALPARQPYDIIG